MTTVYKVCHVGADGVFRSCCGNMDFRECWRAVYAIDQTTLPPIEGSKLFAFDRFDAAHLFIQDTFCRPGHYTILECDADVDEEIMKRLPSWLPDFDMISNFWTRVVADPDNLACFDCGIPRPSHTVLCSSITPRRVAHGHTRKLASEETP